MPGGARRSAECGDGLGLACGAHLARPVTRGAGWEAAGVRVVGALLEPGAAAAGVWGRWALLEPGAKLGRLRCGSLQRHYERIFEVGATVISLEQLGLTRVRVVAASPEPGAKDGRVSNRRLVGRGGRIRNRHLRRAEDLECQDRIRPWGAGVGTGYVAWGGHWDLVTSACVTTACWLRSRRERRGRG